MRQSEYVLFENSPTEYFNAAYPIGNGHLGAMVYGSLPRMRFGINHDELWSGDGFEDFSAWNKEDFFRARDLAISGRYKEATEILQKKYAKYVSSAYLTLGDLFVDFSTGSISDYRRSLDLRSSLASVEFLLDGNRVSVTSLASFPENLIAVRIVSNAPVSFSVSLDIPLAKEYRSSAVALTVIGEALQKSDYQTTSNSFPPPLEASRGSEFAAVVTLKSNGKTASSDKSFFVSGATDTIVLFTAATTYKDGQAHGKELNPEKLTENLLLSLAKEYSDIEREHENDVKNFFDRVELTLGEEDFSDIPTSERIDNFERSDGSIDTDLITLAFNYGRYLTIAGSREGSVPLNLQGIWNDMLDPPWCSNYTTNINLEMNYWPTLATGMPELLNPLESLVQIIARRGEKCAKQLFGAEGFCANNCADIYGFCTPSQGLPIWSFFPFSAAWIIRELYKKYEYTENKEYLAKIYPLFDGSVRFMLDTLVDDGSYLIFAPGTSPENSYILDGDECHVAKSSTMYGAIIRDTVSAFIKASEVLGIKNETVTRAIEAQPRLLPIRITDDGRIEEWYFGDKTPCFTESQPKHRHISHLYDLYPANNITPYTPEFFSAAAKSLDIRGDESTGWSLGWKMNCRARLRDGEGVMRLMRLFFRRTSSIPDNKSRAVGGGVYANLLCAHPPFQIDGNFAFTAAVIEMLVGEYNGEPIPLPALPSAIRKGRVRGIFIKGNRRVDIAFSDGKVTEFKIY